MRVRVGGRGGWQVSVPGRHSDVSCENLDEARRVARQCVARGHARELIVYDAYHRVLERQRVDRQVGDRAA